jgi:DNA (cytosine-5)-methyltransferase 1
VTYLELFAGVGGMSRGLESAGLHCAGHVEWDQSAAGVIAHHWPDTPLWCDVTKFTGAEVQDRVDLLAFGSPCQDLSVAGKRRGMGEGTRSGLFFDALRIAAHLRIHNGLRYLLWENVVGALSSHKGADFAAVLGEMAELGARDIAWRVLDAQWFGVAQRRRRVFVVCDLGGERASEILALAEGLSGHPAPSREAGQKPAGTLASRTKGGGGLGTDTELDGGLVAPTLDASYGKKWGLDNQHIDGGCGLFVTTPCVPASLGKGVGHNKDGFIVPVISPALNTMRGGNRAPDTQAYIAHTLRAEGHDASEDGTGRGVPLTCFHPTQEPIHSSDGTTHCMGAQATIAAMTRSGVRRLTPTECERLMGWPDGWTQTKAVLVKDGNRWIPTGKTAAQADGPRYKQCGNGVVSSVAEWIGRRIGSNDPCASPQNRKLDTCARGAAE